MDEEVDLQVVCTRRTAEVGHIRGSMDGDGVSALNGLTLRDGVDLNLCIDIVVFFGQRNRLLESSKCV